MEDERRRIGTNGVLNGSFEDKCSLDGNIPTNTTTINSITNKFSTNANNSSSSNCSSNANNSVKGQDRFLPDASSSNNHNNKEQDRFLPIANVGRIMKKVIPGNGKISKEAKETVQECVSEFISFVTGEASDKCQREKRKTINGDDIIWAITTLGFEDYVTPLKQYLNRYRELEGEKLNVPKRQRLQNHDQNPNLSYPSAYSSTNLLSDPPFVSVDQAFSLPFAPNSVQQLQTHEQVDTVGQW